MPLFGCVEILYFYIILQSGGMDLFLFLEIQCIVSIVIRSDSVSIFKEQFAESVHFDSVTIDRSNPFPLTSNMNVIPNLCFHHFRFTQFCNVHRDSRVGTTLYALAYFGGLFTVIMGEDQVLVNVPDPFQPTQGSILEESYIVTDEMHFEFTVQVDSLGSGISNVLHGTLFNCNDGAGCRMPGIWLSSAHSQTRGFYISFSNDERTNPSFWTHNEADAIVAGGTYHLTMDITQNWITVKVNEETVLDESKPSHPTNPDGSYVNSKLYASDPWFPASDVTISNLIITTPVPDQVIQCSFANHDGSDVMCGATIKIDDPSHDQGDPIQHLTTFQFPGMECANPRISMDFVSQDFGHDEEYLEVYDGSSTFSPLLGKCGDVDDDDSWYDDTMHYVYIVQ